MKHSYLVTLFSSALLLGAQTACERSGNHEPEPEPAPRTEYYLSPTPPKGRVVLVYPDTRAFSYLGRGYDATGDYLGNSSVKSPVIDLQKIPDGEITIFTSASSGRKAYDGNNAREFLQSVKLRSTFTVPSENAGDLLFTGTIQNSELISEPYDYSTQYTFICSDFYVSHERQTISVINKSKMMRYLSDAFMEDAETLLPEYLVEIYGTHVLQEVYLGHRIRSLYRAVITETAEEIVRAAYRGHEARRAGIYRLSGEDVPHSDKEQPDNYGGAIAVEFHGGEGAALPHLALLPNELIGGPMDISAWRKSANKNNLALVALPQNGLTPIPIYELIADPVKQQQVKEAVIQHIKSKQLPQMETTPIIQAYNGKQHRYFTSYSDFKNLSDKSYTSYGVIGSVFAQHQPETVPLYLFSNGKNNRLSLTEHPEDNPQGYTLAGTAGFVYGNYQSNLQIIYEITDGNGFAYTTENRQRYGKEGRWKPTGKEFYTKKISV